MANTKTYAIASPRILYLLLCLILGAALLVPGQPTGAFAAIEADPLTPRAVFVKEMRAVLDQEVRLMEELEAEFRSATDDAAALDVQRRIAELRQKTEIDLLGCQARYARSLGRVELAEEIEKDIAELRDPDRALKKARKDEVSR